MLASTCSIRFFSLASVKFLSRVFTALNLLPSIAATAWVNSSSCRHSTTNWRHAARIAGPLSFRKSAMVLKSGRQPPRQPHQLDVALRLALQPPARRHLVDVAVDVDLQQRARVIAPDARRLRHDPLEPERRQVQLIDEDVDHPDRVLLAHVVVQELRKQNALAGDPHLRRSASSTTSRLCRCARLSCVGVFTQPRSKAVIAFVPATGARPMGARRALRSGWSAGAQGEGPAGDSRGLHAGRLAEGGKRRPARKLYHIVILSESVVRSMAADDAAVTLPGPPLSAFHRRAGVLEPRP